MFFKNKKGYTLIELLIVIAIIAVLASISIPVVTGVVQRSRLSKDQVTAKNYQTAISLWMSEQPNSENVYSSHLSGTDTMINGSLTQTAYTSAYMGTNQFPGTEFKDETAIRNSVVTAIESVAMQDFNKNGRHLLVEHPESTGYGFKYYYKTGVVSLEKTDSTADIYPDPAYDYYIWLDYSEELTPSVKSKIDLSANVKPKVARIEGIENSKVSKETFLFSFSIGSLDAEKCVFTIENEKNSFTLSGKITSPQVFVPDNYRIKYYYAGELKADAEFTIKPTDYTVNNPVITISFSGGSSSVLQFTSSVDLFKCTGGVLTEYLGNEEIIIVPEKDKNNNKITAIGTGAFDNCTARRITLPSSVDTIQEGAFTNCPNLEYLLMPSPTLLTDAIKNNPKLSNIEFYVPQNLTPTTWRYVNRNAIHHCYELKKLEFSYCYIIYTGAFNSILTENDDIKISINTSVESVPTEIANSPKVKFNYSPITYFVNDASGTTYFNSIAYSKFDGNTSLVIPSRMFTVTPWKSNSYTKIASPTNAQINATKNLRTLFTSIELVEGYTEIGENAFSGYQFSSITLPATMRRIGAKAFAGHKCLSIEIPQGVTYIGKSAFTSQDLETVIIKCDTDVLTNEKVLEGCLRIRTLLIYNYDGDKEALTPEDFGLDSEVVKIVFA